VVKALHEFYLPPLEQFHKIRSHHGGIVAAVFNRHASFLRNWTWRLKIAFGHTICFAAPSIVGTFVLVRP
jgi:hypothetical protein